MIHYTWTAATLIRIISRVREIKTNILHTKKTKQVLLLQIILITAFKIKPRLRYNKRLGIKQCSLCISKMVLIYKININKLLSLTKHYLCFFKKRLTQPILQCLPSNLPNQIRDQPFRLEFAVVQRDS